MAYVIKRLADKRYLARRRRTTKVETTDKLQRALPFMTRTAAERHLGSNLGVTGVVVAIEAEVYKGGDW